jgi:pyruvate/2-oxoglutarate/acetoin dehydrogenase E1 component
MNTIISLENQKKLKMPAEGIVKEFSGIIDLRTVRPMDYDTIRSVKIN